MTGMTGPLSGLRIIAIEQFASAPFGSMHLTDLGAEVIKIENPHEGGDVGRRTGAHYLSPTDTDYFQAFNRNKRSLTLDLKADAGQTILHKLVRTSDALLNNLRGDLPETLGLTYPHLAAIHPPIVCAHLSAYGRTGSRARLPGYDFLMQAETGAMELTGEPDSVPARFGLSVIDYSTGLTQALALLAAVMGAQRTGKGCDVDVSLFDVAAAQLTYQAAWYLNRGEVTGRLPRSSHASQIPSQIFTAKDGWVYVMAMLPKFWEALARAIERPDLLDDPRFIDEAARRDNRDALTAELDPVFATKTTAAWVEHLQGKVPVAPVNDLAQALENPYLAEAGLIASMAHPQKPGFKVMASAVKIDGARADVHPAPELGADNHGILAEIGYSAQEIAALEADGVI